jgi:hypothetical protein
VLGSARQRLEEDERLDSVCLVIEARCGNQVLFGCLFALYCFWSFLRFGDCSYRARVVLCVVVDIQYRGIERRVFWQPLWPQLDSLLLDWGPRDGRNGDLVSAAACVDCEAHDGCECKGGEEQRDAMIVPDQQQFWCVLVIFPRHVYATYLLATGPRYQATTWLSCFPRRTLRLGTLKSRGVNYSRGPTFAMRLIGHQNAASTLLMTSNLV